MIRRIAINTGGGDAPGLNAVIQAATLAAIRLGWEVVGIREGYSGILDPQNYPDGGLVRLTPEMVRNISHLGGTILGTVNKGNPFKVTESLPGGMTVEHDRSDEVMQAFQTHGLDALIAIGGDGSLTIANSFAKRGLRVVGVPKTIDNDLASTVLTFGFQTAVSFATECIDRLHSTAESHRRIIVVEVMGRYAGWIALNAGIAGRADAILIPEIPYCIDKLAQHIRTRNRPYSIVVAAEGAKPLDGQVSVLAREAGRQERLGGIADRVARQVEQLTGKEARSLVLGHLLRGGSPVAIDRILGLSFGAAAVAALQRGESGIMVALQPPHVKSVPLDEAISTMKVVPPDGDLVSTCRALDICLGD
ncbi:MAG: ATP-dependent 6-phosphofructokinase [Acidobacteria bacterium]|nr:ATP-dependent 6-phosphofructokinase [Acidobacteriota bacterium]